MKKTIWLSGLLLAASFNFASAADFKPTASAVCIDEAVYQSRSSIQAVATDEQFLYTGLLNGKIQKVAKTNWAASDLVTAPAAVRSITLDATNVYYAASVFSNGAQHSQLFSIPKAGGSAQLLGDTTDTVTTLLNDDSYLYWLTTSTDNTKADGKVDRVRKTGGTVETLAAGLSVPIDIALDATSVYYTEEGVSRLPPFGLSKVAKSGGAVVHLTTGKPGEGIAGVADGLVYFQQREDDRNNGLYTVPVGGGSVTALHTPLFAPSKIQRLADGEILYSVGYTDWTYGTVGSMTVYDTAGNPIVLGTLPVRTFVVDSTSIYGVILGNGRIDRFCLNYATAPRITKINGSSATIGGSHLTITGEHFQTGLRVTFDGLEGTVQSVNSTTIQVTTPAHDKGTVDVYVINPDGESGRSAIFYDPQLNNGNPPPPPPDPPARKRAVRPS